MKKILSGAVAMMMMLGCFLTGCGSSIDSGEDNNPKPKKIKSADINIAVILKSQNADYWDYVIKGAQDAADEIGCKVYFTAPELETMPEKQIEMINEAVANKVTAIVAAPINWQQASPLKDASAADIPVVLIDSDCTGFNAECFIATDSEEAGRMAAREAAKLLNNDEDGLGGTCGIIAHTLGTDTAGARFEGFSRELKDQYAAEMVSEPIENKINICGSEFCDSDYDKAKERTLVLLERHPDIDLLYCTNETVSRGALDAVKEAGLAGKIKIIGFDSSDEMIAAVNDGTMNGFLVQNPYQMGYLGVTNAASMIRGESVSSSIDTGVTYVTKENVNNGEIQHILNPLKTDS